MLKERNRGREIGKKKTTLCCPIILSSYYHISFSLQPNFFCQVFHLLFGFLMFHSNLISTTSCLWNWSHWNHQRHPVAKSTGHFYVLILQGLSTTLFGLTSPLLKHSFLSIPGIMLSILFPLVIPPHPLCSSFSCSTP